MDRQHHLELFFGHSTFDMPSDSKCETGARLVTNKCSKIVYTEAFRVEDRLIDRQHLYRVDVLVPELKSAMWRKKLFKLIIHG